LAFGAFLLAFTNMVAIQFVSSVVLWFTGFRKVTRRTGLGLREFVVRNTVSIVILLALSVILTANLQHVILRQLFESATRGILQQEIGASAGSHLVNVRFETTSDTTIVRAVMRGPASPSATQVAAMETKLPSPPDGTEIELRVRFVQTVTINRDGQMFTDVEFYTGE